MFCTKDLGENRVVEHFPVGRRLAFDAARGRLWVVCRKCERWNLTPIEERWEAVEECEKLFRGTRVRASTENVGIARHPEGLELVRIGRPERPEFAAWRYGDQFGRRRKKALLVGGGIGVAFAAFAIGGMVTGAVSTALVAQSGNLVNLWNNMRTRGRMRLDGGEVVKIKTPMLTHLRIVEHDDEQGWAIRLKSKDLAVKLPAEVRDGPKDKILLTGETARRAGRVLLPAINESGGKKDQVQEAVRAIEEAGHPEAFLARAPALKRKQGWNAGSAGEVLKMPAPTRLALEMALHEEEEMRALQGELWRLERAWEEAEEIAAIADGLLLPDGVEERLGDG
jgi:hypothetical protein